MTDYLSSFFYPRFFNGTCSRVLIYFILFLLLLFFMYIVNYLRFTAEILLFNLCLPFINQLVILGNCDDISVFLIFLVLFLTFYFNLIFYLFFKLHFHNITVIFCFPFN